MRSEYSDKAQLMSDDPVKQFHPHWPGIRYQLQQPAKVLQSLKVAFEAGHEASLILALKYCDTFGVEPDWVTNAKYDMLIRYVSGVPTNSKIDGKKISTLQSEFTKWLAVEQYLAEFPDASNEAAYNHVAEHLKSDLVAAQSVQSIKSAHLRVRKDLSDESAAAKYFILPKPTPLVLDEDDD